MQLRSPNTPESFPVAQIGMLKLMEMRKCSPKVITNLAKKIMQADRKCVNEGSAYDGWRHSLN